MRNNIESLDPPTLISRKMSMTVTLHFMNFSVKSHKFNFTEKIHIKIFPNEIFKIFKKCLVPSNMHQFHVQYHV